MPDHQRPRLAGVRAIVFDFDYTLVDATPGFVECHNAAARRLGLRIPELESIRRSIGLGLDGAVRFLHPALAPTDVQRYVEIYQSRADEVMVEQTSVIPGVSEALVVLNERGIRMAVVSHKLRRRVEDTLERRDLMELFDVVVGPEDVTRLKPDPEGTMAALAKLGASTADALYVGDTTIDGETARNAGVRFVGVVSGATTAGELASGRPALILSSVADLPDAIERP